MCISAFYSYDILYATIYVNKSIILANVNCAFKFLLEFVMTSSMTEKPFIKYFQTEKNSLGPYIISFSLDFSLKIRTLHPYSKR